MNAREDPPPSPKIGDGHLAGMARQGLRELRAAIYPESNIAQQPDYGLVGMATPGEVAEARRSDLDLDRWEQEGGLVPQDAKVQPPRDDPGKEDKGLDRE